MSWAPNNVVILTVRRPSIKEAMAKLKGKAKQKSIDFNRSKAGGFSFFVSCNAVS